MSKTGKVKPSRVSGFALGGDVAHLALGFEFREESFLGASAVMEQEDAAGRDLFVGCYDLVFEFELDWLEEMELNRSFAGLSDLPPVEKDANFARPTLRLPSRLEERPFGIDNGNGV